MVELADKNGDPEHSTSWRGSKHDCACMYVHLCACLCKGVHACVSGYAFIYVHVFMH